MKLFYTKRSKKVLLITSILAFVLALTVGFCSLYVNDYYHADTAAIKEFGTAVNVDEETWEDGTLVYKPTGTVNAGFIFYPGGKVEHTAYAPLMRSLAEEGVLCIVVEMPFRLAVLDVNAADGLKGNFPEIEDWYIGGHSLGGSMAASYAASNEGEFKGLVLLAAYSTKDLKDSGLNVLSLYGSEDGVMNRKKYDKCVDNLPEGFEEYVIGGGNHAYFGMYGEQDGDGEATISRTKQISLTTTKIVNFMF